MKRKLLLIVCAVLGMLQAKAYSTSDLTSAGWALVSSLTDNTSNVYVLVDAGSDNYAVSWNTSDATGRPVYVDLPNPITTPDVVWTIESRGDKFALRNIISQYYFNSSSTGWQDFMAATYETGSFTFTYSNPKYSITAVSVTGNNYVGPWNNNNAVSLTDGIEGVAANKSSAQAPGFKLYKMAKATYAKKYLQANPNLSAPVDLSFLIVNPTIYQGTNKTTIPSGWTKHKQTTGNGNYTENDSGDTQLEAWHWLNTLDADYYQTIASLPGGQYALTAYIHSRDASVGNVYIWNSTNGKQRSSSPEAGNDKYADKTTEYLEIPDNGSANIGMEVSGTATWFTADNFRLQAKPYVSTLATGVSNYASITSGLWYSISAPVTGDYYIKASAVTTISYTQTGTDCIDASFSTLSFSAGETKKQSLSSGTLYFKANSDVTITIMPENCTSLITNPGFESTTARTDNLAAGESAAGDDYESSGWKLAQSSAWSSSAVVAYGGTGQVNGASAPSTDNAGNTGNALGVSVGWGGTNKYQSTNAVTLPAGVYKLTVYGYNNHSGATQITSVNGFVPTLGDASLSTKTYFSYGTWEEDVIEFALEEATEGKFQVGGTAISGGSGNNAKVFFDNLTLTYSPFAETSDYTALAAAIAAAEANTLGFEVGEYAPYTNVGGVTALAAAKAINPSVANAKTTVQGATTALTGATWTANIVLMDAIYDGQFASYNEGDLDKALKENSIKMPGGWIFGDDSGTNTIDHIRQIATFSSFTGGRAMFFHPGSVTYGQTVGYTMPLKANSVYKLSFQYAGWYDKVKDQAYGTYAPSVSILNENSEGKALAALPDGADSPNISARSYAIYFATDATPGSYKFTYASPNNVTNSTIGNLSLIRVAALPLSENASVNYVAGTYSSVSLDREFNIENYSTLCLPFAMNSDQTSAAFDEVYAFDAVDGSVLKFTSASEISAGTPYLVKAADDDFSVSNVTLNPATTAGNVTKEGVTFQGTFAPIATLSTVTSYIVSSNKLYQVDSPVGLDGYRAYFTTAGGSTKNFVLDFSEADAISDVRSKMEDGKSEIFNLAGQRLNKAQKGINIINGKKVLVK